MRNIKEIRNFLTNCLEWSVKKECRDHEGAVFMGASLIEIINSGESINLKKYIGKKRKHIVNYISVWRDLAICDFREL